MHIYLEHPWIVLFIFSLVAATFFVLWVVTLFKYRAEKKEVERLSVERSEDREWWGLVCQALASGDIKLLSTQIDFCEPLDRNRLMEALSESSPLSLLYGKSANDLSDFVQILRELPKEIQPKKLLDDLFNTFGTRLTEQQRRSWGPAM